MKALKLKKDGLVANILTWHIDKSRQAAEREMEVIFDDYATRGVCAAFGQMIRQSFAWVIWKIIEIVITVALLISLTIFALPFRFLFKGERLDYGWFDTMRGNAFVPISWMPTDGKKTVGPLATKKAQVVWGWLFVAYLLTSTAASIGDHYELWNIFDQGGVVNFVAVLTATGTFITGIFAMLVVAVLAQSLVDFLKDQEVKSLAKAKTEAKRRHFCPQIEWV